MSEQLSPVVLDIGSHSIKAGIADNERPSHMIRSVIGQSIDDSESKKDEWIGDAVFNEDCTLKKRVKYPITRGKVSDWDSFEKILDYTFGEENLNLMDPTDHNILTTMVMESSKKHKETLLELMMEAYSFNAFYLSLDATLALYSGGITTGLVCNVGSEVSSSVPIYEGYGIPHAMHRVDLAGNDLNHYLKQLIFRGDKCSSLSPDMFASVQGRETLRKMKEEICYVNPCAPKSSVLEFERDLSSPKCTKVIPPVPSAIGSASVSSSGSCATPAAARMDDSCFFAMTSDDEKLESNQLDDAWPIPRMADSSISSNLLSHQTPRYIDVSEDCHYEMPDGSIITIDGNIRHECCELLFNPSLLDSEEEGLSKIVTNCIMKCDIDLRSDLFSNIVVCGGSTKFSGLEQRMQSEIENLAPMRDRVKVQSAVKKEEDKSHAVWIGGSVFSGLSCLDEVWIYQDEYLEYGPSFVHRRCV